MAVLRLFADGRLTIVVAVLFAVVVVGLALVGVPAVLHGIISRLMLQVSCAHLLSLNK